MSKASGSIDLKALKAAGANATEYITEIDSDGIFISPSSNEEPMEESAGNSVRINGDGMDVYKDGVSVAHYGDTGRIGLEESSHLSILGNSISGVASNGIEYFEVSENGGSKTTTSYTNIFSSTTYVQPTRTVDLSSTTTSAKGVWLNITTGSPFRIKIEYFCRTAQTATAKYDSRSYGFVKGTTLSTAYVDYNGTNTITIHGYPSIPSSALRFIGCRVYLGRNQTVTLPFYRFGEDVAESGSGYSFLTGRGTKSTNATWPQLVTGKYNDSNSNALFIVGNGESENSRSNALTVDWQGNIIGQAMAGMIQMFAGSTAPTGWLICDGQAVSRTTYATLFSVIGTTYGTGDGSTTFNLPDMRGRTAIGVGDGTATNHTNHTLAEKGGRENAIVPYHRHTTTATGNEFSSGSGSESAYMKTSNRSLMTKYTSYAGSDGNATGANMQPYLTLNYIICTGKTS